jgi:hypothetical protein
MMHELAQRLYQNPPPTFLLPPCALAEGTPCPWLLHPSSPPPSHILTLPCWQSVHALEQGALSSLYDPNRQLMSTFTRLAQLNTATLVVAGHHRAGTRLAASAQAQYRCARRTLSRQAPGKPEGNKQRTPIELRVVQAIQEGPRCGEDPAALLQTWCLNWLAPKRSNCACSLGNTHTHPTTTPEMYQMYHITGRAPRRHIS